MFAALAVTLAFGFSTAAVFWTAEVLGQPARSASSLELLEADGDIVIAAAYWTSATVWGGLVIMLAVVVLPLAAWVLRRARMLVACVGGLVLAGAALVVLVATTGNPWWCVPAVGVLGLAGVLTVVAAGDGFPKLVSQDYPGDDRDEEVEATVVRGWRFAMARYRYHHVIGALTIPGGFCSAVWAGLCVRSATQGRHDIPFSEDGPVGAVVSVLTVGGVLAVTALASALVTLGIASWRQPSIRTTVGILWDMLSFWPRVAHPLCPMPYGSRAIRAVALRSRRLLDGLTGYPQAQHVVLSGHSQGSVIALAAAATLAKTGKATSVSLVTYGSQLQFIYARMFPTYLGQASIQEARPGNGSSARAVPMGTPVITRKHDAEHSDLAGVFSGG